MVVAKIDGVVQNLRTLAEQGESEGRSDAQLLRDFASRRDEAAFAVLVRRHGPMVFGVCRRVLQHLQDAEDAFQATFLVLVCRAAALRHREVLGNWLHGVAYRTALKARAAAASRLAKERTVAQPEAIHDPPGNEALAVLDRELNHLPARYRAPIVLCDLEGKTYREAARLLGCPEGTVAGRLARARALLAKRLTRQGLALTAAALTTEVLPRATAALPPLLAARTVQAAGGPAAAPVAALAEAVVKAMLLRRLTTVGTWLAALSLLGVTSALALHSIAGEESVAKTDSLEVMQDTKPSSADARPKVQAEEKRMAVLSLKWQRPILLDKSDETRERDEGAKAKPWIDKALAARGDAPLVPGFRHLAVGNVVFYRTHNDLRAVYLADEPQPDGYKAGAIHCKSTLAEGGLANLHAYLPWAWPLWERCLKEFAAADLPQLLLENNLAGAISSDGKQVFWIDDVEVLPPAAWIALAPADLDNNLLAAWKQEVKPRLLQNSLTAVDVESGKMTWRLGGIASGPGPFDKTHFLGVPLSLGGKLYVLNETNQGDLRLLVLDPLRGMVLHTLQLDTVPESQRFLVNLRRRVNAAQLVGHDGTLVCLPHAGKVYGVDVAKQDVRWMYSYQKDPPPKAANVPLGYWKAPAAFVASGKLVFTAADDEHIHCVNLKDGKFLWKVQRADDLYVAGVAGDKIVVVGNGSCRALALKDGTELWKLATGTPSGLGVFDKTTYLLPLKKGASSKQPEIAYLDVDQGRLVGTSPLKEVPGNLMLHRDMIVSQSATSISAYVREKPK
jgi:RNA polymerase sigma factor (sigma-70 family)